ncbi:thioredoxin-like protein [Chytriomyces sp. MP71]|nr:thioredoxin-like protein [Chytriomyces sp. MP71]
MRLGDVAPDFSASTTQGPLTLHAYKRDSWAVLFSHPEDFTPVCTTELGAVARLQREFDARGVKVIGLSCSSLQDHHTWIQDINETQDCSVAFPIIADPTREIAALYDMLDHQDETNVDAAGMPLTVRAVFVLDPRNMVRLMITYPASCGRNFVEILRVIDSLQLTDSRKVATPADWRVGDDVIVHNSLKGDEALKLFPDMRTVKPYLRFTKI